MYIIKRGNKIIAVSSFFIIRQEEVTMNTEKNTILTDLQIKSLAKKIEEKSGKTCFPTIDMILENLKYLKVKKEGPLNPELNDGKDHYFLPLEYKKAILYILFPNRKYKFVEGWDEKGYYICECMLWLDGNTDAVPDAYGYARDNVELPHLPEKIPNIEASLPAVCRGNALKDAIRDIGLFIGFDEDEDPYGILETISSINNTSTNSSPDEEPDNKVSPAAAPIKMDNLDEQIKDAVESRKKGSKKTGKKASNPLSEDVKMPFSEETESNLSNEKETSSVPLVQTPTANTSSPLYEEETMISSSENESPVMGMPNFSLEDDDENDTKEQKNNQIVSDEESNSSTLLQHQNEVSSTMTYEDALKAIADIGNYKGMTLEEVLGQCRKGIVALLIHGSDIKDALITIINHEGNEDLKEKYEELSLKS